MSNYCANYLYVYGDKYDRDFFMEKVLVYENLNLQAIFPLSGDPKKQWGTNSNCCIGRLKRENDYDRVYFLTAESPYSENVQKNMCEKFPKLKFELLYAERIMNYQGYYRAYFDETIENVVIVNHKEECKTCNNCYPGCEWYGSGYCEEHEDYLEDPRYDELFQNSG